MDLEGNAGHNTTASSTRRRGLASRFRSRTRYIDRRQIPRVLAQTRRKVNLALKNISRQEVKEFAALSSTIAVNNTAIPTVASYALT